MGRFETRGATPEDAEAVASIYARAFADCIDRIDGAREAASASGFQVLLQTGHAFLVAGHPDQGVAGAVRHREEDGIAWFDLLASLAPGAGRELARAVDRLAQDRGLRLVRTRLPDEGRLPDVFARWGYLPISRQRRETTEGPVAELVLEKRVPLLTVREQRRSDAKAIAALSGLDPWPFEQGTRPGWFVLADGDRVAGVVGVRDAGAGVADITAPLVAGGYSGRGLELWMLQRAAYYAETNGFHTARVDDTTALRSVERDLEDRQWFHEGDRYVRRFIARPEQREDVEDW